MPSICLGTTLPEQNEEDLFLELLTKANNPNQSNVEIIANNDALTRFAFDYPDSRFADDSQILPILMSFFGAATAKDKKGAELFIPFIERSVSKFPNGKIEKETISKLEEIFGSGNGAFLVPNDNLLNYFRGFLAFELQEFNEAIKYYTILKDELDYSIDPDGYLARDIYLPLAISYKKLNKLSELSELEREAKRRFPNNKDLLSFITSIIDK